jgi:Domain of unknown function (DUF4424)
MGGLPQTLTRWFAFAAASAVFAAVDACAARASEPTAELPAGGLAYTGATALVTEREDIIIAPGRIRATYIIRNFGDGARTALVAFALPEIDMLALDNAGVENPAFDPQNPGNYVGFAATVDGQPAEIFLQSNALALSLVDVTNVLKTYGLPLYPLQAGLVEQLGGLADTAKVDLQNRGVIRSSDAQLEPIWSLKSALFWQQPFAAGQVRTVSVSYQPIAGSAAWSTDHAAVLQQRYCIPETAAAALTARASRGEAIPLKWVTYLANAGAVARGSVGQYRVTLETSGKGAAYACSDGSSTPTSRGRESVLTDHVAEGEIQVLFVE